MTNKIDDVIVELIKDLKKEYPSDFSGIYLFGLFLDGKMHDGEDIELAAIFDVEDKSKREQIWPIVGKVETEFDVCIDLYPHTQESFKKDEYIYDEVMEEGIFYNNMGIRK